MKEIIFKGDSYKELCLENNLEFIAKLPIDNNINDISNEDYPFILRNKDSLISKEYFSLSDKIERSISLKKGE